MKKISSNDTKKILLELMDDIHYFCVIHQIKYSLAFGTLIGAIRHQGFIPWDDDIDLYMMRDDYDKFRRTYKPRHDYIKLNDCETDTKYHRTFLKVEDSRTIVHEISALDYMGISIDIFPVDNLYDNMKASEKLCQKVEFYRKMHIVKSLTLRNNVSGFKKIIMCIGKAALLPFNIHQITMRMVNLSKKGINNSRYVTILDMNHNKNLIFERNVYENVVPREFEKRNYYTIHDADLWLRQRYGNYMEIPPVDERENGSCHEFEGAYYKDDFE